MTIENNRRIEEVCKRFGGKYEEYAGAGRCILTPEQYRRFREEYKVDFIVERNKMGVSFVSQKDNDYFMENWMKPRKPVYVMAELIDRGKKNWELIEFRPISRIERNKIKHEVEQGTWGYVGYPSRSRIMRDAEAWG